MLVARYVFHFEDVMLKLRFSKFGPIHSVRNGAAALADTVLAICHTDPKPRRSKNVDAAGAIWTVAAIGRRSAACTALTFCVLCSAPLFGQFPDNASEPDKRFVSEPQGVTLPIQRPSISATPADPQNTPAVVQPLFRSATLNAATPSQPFEVSVAGKTDVYLVVSDAGDGFSCDWANWIDLKLISNDSQQATQSLSEVDWESAAAGWGKPGKNVNVEGQALMLGGKAYPSGIGTHANSLIHFRLPPGFDRLTGIAALDDAGIKQGGGSTVVFEIYDQQPPVSPSEAGHEANAAVAGLDLAPGIEATLFAAEPDIYSVTNLDIDHRGRIWVCEVVNYRSHNGKRSDGDRVLILEDTDQDGIADTKKVFYQGRDIDSAMGICVLGKHVIVSSSPNVWIFTDENGDDVPDDKRLLFSNTGQPQHDHSAHSFVYGPDGKLYWNFGNTGKAVHDTAGNVVVDLAGNPVVDNGKPYFGGMIFRCDPDGSNFEVLAHNFRNNYEAAIDSFGSIWQSDNDDDGNRGVRINYVTEFGNYGYRDQQSGEMWSAARTGMSDEIPIRHWHQNDPGVIPNLLQTGAGSPCAMTIYEGRMLPQTFWDQMIHCDAGPNVVRSYPVTEKGAGFSASLENLAVGTRDQWFRPVDPCVAPDGSLFVSDWYDPGVGGHGMGDLDRGRIFRFAAPNSPYVIPKFDFDSVDGAIEGLRNPALSVRALAHQSLQAMGGKAEAALKEMLDDPNPRLAARALWLLGKMPETGNAYVEWAISHPNPQLRMVGIRIARQTGLANEAFLQKVVQDPSAQVRREVAVALRSLNSDAAADLWLTLAQAYKGDDRWELEALGIAAENKWDACLARWIAAIGDQWNSPVSRDIIWRSRAEATSQWLVKIIQSADLSEQQSQAYYRALDFQQPAARDRALEALLLEE